MAMEKPDNVDKFVKTLKRRPLDSAVRDVVALLKRRQVTGSTSCATVTIHILRHVVSRSNYKTVEQLIERVQQVGQVLIRAQSHELVIGNVVRRVLGLIRDEAVQDRNDGADSVPDLRSSPLDSTNKQKDPSQMTAPALPLPTRPLLSRPPTLSGFSTPFSMLSLLSSPAEYVVGSGTGTPLGMSGTSTPVLPGHNANIHSLRSEVISGIEEIMDEIDQVDDQVAGHADSQIHPTDYILVYQLDSTIQKFLMRAAQRRRFTVLIAGDDKAAAKLGHAQPSQFRRKLNGAGVKTINISNAGLAAYMCRVDKVVISARAVTAIGGVMADSGAANVALAARECQKPVIALMGIYKLSPEEGEDPRRLVELGDAETCIDYSRGDMVNTVTVEMPMTELVPPGLVELYISNLGVHSQDHLRHLVEDHYNDADLELCRLHNKSDAMAQL